MLNSLIKLQIKLSLKGDRLLLFYFSCLTSFIISFYFNCFLWSILSLILSNIYLTMYYRVDSKLSVFYKIHNIKGFDQHISKIIIIYFLSLIQLGLFTYFEIIADLPLQFFIHFISFYTMLLLYKIPEWLQLFSFFILVTIISLVLSGASFISSMMLYIIACIMVALDTVILNFIYGSERQQYSI